MGRKPRFENSRELIVDAAERLFQHFGYDKTTMDDVAREANMGKGTLYTYFKNKDALVGATIERHFKGIVATMRSQVAAHQGPALPLLRQLMLDEILRTLDHAQSNFQVLTRPGLPFALPQFDMTHHQDMMALFNGQFEVLAQVLALAAQQQEIGSVADYDRLARLLHAMLGHYHPHTLHLRERDEVEAEVGEILDLALAGLAVRGCHLPAAEADGSQRLCSLSNDENSMQTGSLTLVGLPAAELKQ